MDKYQHELREMERLETALDTMNARPSEPYETKVDIGAGLLVSAIVDPPHECVHIHIGLGIHVELPLKEALVVCSQRKKILRSMIQLQIGDSD